MGQDNQMSYKMLFDIKRMGFLWGLFFCLGQKKMSWCWKIYCITRWGLKRWKDKCVQRQTKLSAWCVHTVKKILVNFCPNYSFCKFYYGRHYFKSTIFQKLDIFFCLLFWQGLNKIYHSMVVGKKIELLKFTVLALFGTKINMS